MSGLVENKKRKRSSENRGILKKTEKIAPVKERPSHSVTGECGLKEYFEDSDPGTCTNYGTLTEDEDKIHEARTIDKNAPVREPRPLPRPTFRQHVLIRQTSDGGNRYQSGAKGTAKFYDGELGPEGVIKTDEEMETSNKQRDIDYVFVYVIHSFSELKLVMMSKPQVLEQIRLNITKYSTRRAHKEKGRNRVAYTPTKKDIYDKCVEILAELDTKDRIDVKAGKSTLTIGDDGIKGVLGKIWAVRLKDYLEPKKSAVAAAAGKRRRDKRELADKTTLIF